MEKNYLEGLKQYAGNTPPSEQRITEVGEVQAALAQSRELARLATAIVTQLCGCKTEACGNTDANEVYEPDGLLLRLSSEARRCMSEMHAAMSDLRRLQKAIP